MSAAKDTIYIDVDDEITAVIDKVQGSSHKIVALVLPKRATVLQSIVNMKLLKRTAAESKKNLVLITSEANLLPLAGIVGLHVAKTLQSKPEVPEAPAQLDGPLAVNDDDMPTPDEPLVDPKKSVGELAGLPATKKSSHDDSEESIEVDNDDEPAAETSAAEKVPFNKKLRIPDFEQFRVKLFVAIGVGAVLIVAGIVAFFVMPKAVITIKTDTVSVTSTIGLTGATTAKAADEQQMIVPALVKEYKKTDSLKVPATGQKDMGTKAGGTLTLTNCINDGQPHTVPAGTGFFSGQFTFVTNEEVVLPTAVYSASTCKSATFGLSRNVEVTAAQAGGDYNLSSRSYSSPASYNTASGSVTAQGSSMTGGTSKIVKVVSQEDVDGAKQKTLDTNNTPANQEVAKQLKAEGYLSLAETFTVASPLVTASPNVGSEAADVTVNIAVTYTMHGVKQDAVTELLEKDIKKHIDTAKQNILNNGLDKAVIHVTEKSATQVKLSLQTLATAGVQQDSDVIKKAVAGKKKGEVQTAIQARPGVKEVTVKYSPFWVYKTPKSTGKITIIFQQSDGSKQ